MAENRAARALQTAAVVMRDHAAGKRSEVAVKEAVAAYAKAARIDPKQAQQEVEDEAGLLKQH